MRKRHLIIATAVAAGAPFLLATSAQAACIASPAVVAVPAVTHQVTVVDSPAVAAVAPTEAVPAVTHDVTVIDTPASDETVIDTPAYDETIIDTPAYDETVIDTPAVAAVPGTDAIPAVTHVVHHDAVTHVVHHDAVTHVVHHDAVTHQVTIIDSPAVAAVPGTPAIPAVTHTEYGFRTRVQLFGSKEVKSVKGYQFVSGSTTKVNGVTIPGHWVAGDSGTYYDIPDVVVNAVWGPSGVPSSVLGTGNVNLDVYGGPNKTVAYKAVKVTTSAGYTDWSDWSDYSTTNPGVATDLKDVRSETVTDKAAVPAVPGKDAIPAVTHQETVIDTAAYDETVIDTPAYDETVVDASAYDETVIDSPAIPATEGSPAIPAVTHVVHHDAVTHTCHHDAVTHVVHHDAVTHVETIIDTPGTPATQGSPAVAAVTHQVTVTDKAAVAAKPAVTCAATPDLLPHTGASDWEWLIAGLGLAAVVVGIGAVSLGRHRRPE